MLLLCLAPARGQSGQQKKQTIEYLQSLQVKGGGFRTVAGEAL